MTAQNTFQFYIENYIDITFCRKGKFTQATFAGDCRTDFARSTCCSSNLAVYTCQHSGATLIQFVTIFTYFIINIMTHFFITLNSNFQTMVVNTLLALSFLITRQLEATISSKTYTSDFCCLSKRLYT